MTIQATDANAAESGGDTGLLTFHRSGDLTAALTVYVSIDGTARQGDDYAPFTQEVTIAAGAADATITLTPENDDLAEGSETVVLTLLPDAGYQIGTPSSATVTIADDAADQGNVVSVQATDASAAETGGNTGLFTISRSGATTAALTVYYGVSGSATADRDYTALPSSVTIPSGSASTTVTVTPLDDSFTEGSETVIVSIIPAATYDAAATSKEATVTIADDVTDLSPVVTIQPTDPSAAEVGPDAGVFTITRTGPTTNALIVSYTVSGRAIGGVDYTSLSGTATINTAASSATINVTPLSDIWAEGVEDVVVTLAAGPAYQVGDMSSAVVTIADDATDTSPVVWVEAGGDALESNTQAGGFVVRRTGPTTAALTVRFTVSGAATPGTDYTALGTTVTIASGADEATVSVMPIDDTAPEATENVALSLAADPAYALGYSPGATVNIIDNDTTVTVAVSDSSAAETGADPGNLTLTRAGSTAGPLTVYYTMTGTATEADDYASLAGSVLIPDGMSSVAVAITPLDDSFQEGSETAILTLTASTAYQLGAQTSATVTIADDAGDAGPEVAIQVTDASANEVGLDPGTFTITPTGALTAALTVYFDVSSSSADMTIDYALQDAGGGAITSAVTIPAGSASTTITVNPLDDSVGELDETVIIEILPNAAYTFKQPASGTVTLADSGADPDPDLKIINAANKRARKLRVAKWENAYTWDQQGTMITKDHFLDLDPDRFYVQAFDPAKKGAGTVTIDLSTDSPGTEYDDDVSTITLTEVAQNSGVFTSKSLILVSNQIDDDYSIDGAADADGPDERTHIVSLEGQVKVVYTRGTVTKTEIANVPTDRVARAHVTIFKKGNTYLIGEPFIDRNGNGGYDAGERYRVIDDDNQYNPNLSRQMALKRAREEIKFLNEQYAQVGLRFLLPVPIEFQNAPARIDSGVIEVSAFAVSGDNNLIKDEKALLQGGFNQ